MTLDETFQSYRNIEGCSAVVHRRWMLGIENNICFAFLLYFLSDQWMCHVHRKFIKKIVIHKKIRTVDTSDGFSWKLLCEIARLKE